MYRLSCTFTLLLLATLLFSACQPVMAEPAAQQAEETAMDVIDQFLEAYRAYDVDKLLSLHTDDAVWTWIDPGKNASFFGPEGKWAGSGKDEIRALFDLNRGQNGYTGYILWSDVQGDQVTFTGLYESPYTRAINVPLVAHSTFTLRDGKIAEWLWTVSPESSRRWVDAVDVAEANKEIVRRLNTEIWNGGNLALIDELYAEDYVRHQAGYPAELQGREGLKQFLPLLRQAFPDFTCSIGNLVAEGDMVVHYGQVCRGVHQGEWMGLPPSGKEMEFTVTATHRLVDGKVTEDWIEYDSAAFMQGLGMELVPAQPPAASGYQSPEVLVQGAHIRSPNGIKAGPDGNLYVASVNGRAVLVIDPETGEILRQLGPEVGVDGPDDVAIGPDGSIYWTDFFRGSVGRLAPDGAMSSQMVGVGVNPIVFSADGRLFAALAFLGDALYELDPNLTAPPRLLAEGLGGLNSFQFGPDGMLYAPVMEKGQVARIDVDADPIQVEIVAEGLNWPVAVKLDSQGRLFTEGDPNAEHAGIVLVDMATGAFESYAAVPHGIDNFVFDAQDRLFVSLLGAGTIAEVQHDGELRLLGPTGLVMPGGVVAVARADGESVYVGDFWMLHEFDGATGELRRTVDGLGPGTVAVDGENMVLSNWFSNSVKVWNPQTEEVVEEYYDFATPLNAVRFQGDLVVAELGTGSVVRASAADPSQRATLATDLVVPAGLVATGEELWVSDRATGNVWQLAAGGEVLAEPKLTASGLDRPEGMALAPGGRLLVAETGTGRLVAIDLATGATSIIAEGLGFSPTSPEGMMPTGLMSSAAVSPSGALYVTGDLANVLYRIDPNR